MDLTKFFVLAEKNSWNWSHQKCHETMQKIKQKAFESKFDLKIEEDYETGVFWATIFLSPINRQELALEELEPTSEAVGIIRYNFPLAILERGMPEEIVHALELEGITVVMVPDYDRDDYSIDPSIIKTILRDNVWSPHVDPQRFSIKELLYTTYD